MYFSRRLVFLSQRSDINHSSPLLQVHHSNGACLATRLKKYMQVKLDEISPQVGATKRKQLHSIFEKHRINFIMTSIFRFHGMNPHPINLRQM